MTTTSSQINRDDRAGFNSTDTGLLWLKYQYHKFPQEDARIKSDATNQNATLKPRRGERTPSRHPLRPIVNGGRVKPSSSVFTAKVPVPSSRHKPNNRCQPPARCDSRPPQVTTPTVLPKRVPVTDPDRTAALWATVRATKSSTVTPQLGTYEEDDGAGQSAQYNTKSSAHGTSSRRGTHGGGKRGSRKGSQNNVGDHGEQRALHRIDAEELSDTRPVPQSSPDLDSYTATPLGSEYTATDTLDTKTFRVAARSAYFEEHVLRPRKIIIKTDNATEPNPFVHFDVDAPPKQKANDYRTIEGLDAAQIWLSLDDDSIEEIIEEYTFMTNQRVCEEEEYASFAKERFLKRQRRFCQVPSDRKWRAERTLQLVAPPKGLYWVPPKSFAADPDEYEFDIRPDCSYWLSLAGFNSAYRSELSDVVYVHNDWITCSYFTIEFKKHGQSIRQATAQAAAASSLALYNRYLLKSRALKVTGGVWTESDKAQMRHYVLTFVGRDFTIWVLQANLCEDNDWDGCTMRRLYSSKCMSSYAVKQLERWINEIHRWGLSQHGPSCQRDVKIILEDIGVDISAIDLS